MDEEQIQKRAYELWEKAGRPEGREEEFWERARESLAIEENQKSQPQPNLPPDSKQKP
jgi:DUF2934 family protein